MNRRCIVDGSPLELVHSFSRAPLGEPAYRVPNLYPRSIWKCLECGHFSSDAHYNQAEFYGSTYANAAYGQEIAQNRERLLSLPRSQSDNFLRTQRIQDFVWKLDMDGALGSWDSQKPRLLDLGSGLGVFPISMKALGWEVTCVEPNQPEALSLSESLAGQVLCSTIEDFVTQDHFQLVTANKVLEHLKDPIAALHKIRHLMRPDSIGYLEVPDGSEAASVGFEREEFFADHFHVFSHDSLRSACELSGLRCLRTEQVVEPSGKFTLYSFVKMVP